MSHTISVGSFFRFRQLTQFAAMAGLALLIGCGPAAEPDADGSSSGETAVADDHAGHDHDDHEGHSHAGKRGGHVLVLEPGHVHAEFVHVDDEDILEVYVDDRPEAVTAVEVMVEIAGQEAKTYTLVATESLGTGGYQLKDPLVLTGIQMADGETNKATLKVTTADGTMTADMTDEHEH